MAMAVSNAVSLGRPTHSRPVNFGQLNSAIARGDLPAAQNAFSAIVGSESPSALAVKARGSMQAIGSAIASGNVEAARKSLAELRSGGKIEVEAATEEAGKPVASDAALSSQADSVETSVISAEASTIDQITALRAATRSNVEVST